MLFYFNSMYSSIHIFVFLGALSPLASSKFLDVKNGAIGKLHYVRVCAENNVNSLDLHLSHRKFNRTHIGIDMNITLPELFDHTYELDVELRLWGDGGWKNNFFHLRRKDACSTLYLLLGPVWVNIIDAAKCKRGCPVAPGYYQFKDLFIDSSMMPIIVQTGRFFLLGKTIKNSITTACLEAEIEIEPKMN